MSLVFDDRKRVLPAGRVAVDLGAMFRKAALRSAVTVRAWRGRHYRPECHYMRGPGPACQRKSDALARLRGAL